MGSFFVLVGVAEMSEFYTESTINCTRKPHFCMGCQKSIDAGLQAKYFATKNDGIFFAGHYHVDCQKAEIEWNNLMDARGDEYQWLWEIRESDDREDNIAWLREEWPDVAARLIP